MNLEQEIISINRKLNELVQKNRVQKKWVSAYWIIELTGWDWKKLQQARLDGLIEYRDKPEQKGRKVYQYNLHSLPGMFIKNKSHEQETTGSEKAA